MAAAQYANGFDGTRSNSIRIEGAEELIYALQSLPQKIGQKYVRRAVARALPPMRAQLLNNTPVGPTGNLRAAVGSVVRSYPRNFTAFGVVGYKRAVSKDTDDNKGYHSHFVEFGTGERRASQAPFLSSYRLAAGGYIPAGWDGPWPIRARQVRGAKALHPLRTAFEATSGRCRDILVTGLEDGLVMAVEEVRRRGAA